MLMMKDIAMVESWSEGEMVDVEDKVEEDGVDE
jgi:hypothetical protein